MSDDWKKKVDDWKDQEKINLDMNRVTEENLKLKEYREKIRKQMEDELKSYLRKGFKCHICGVLSRNWVIEYIDIPGTGGLAMDGDHSPNLTRAIPHYNQPADLYGCVICKKLTCGEHIHKGVCQKCAEKL